MTKTAPPSLPPQPRLTADQKRIQELEAEIARLTKNKNKAEKSKVTRRKNKVNKVIEANQNNRIRTETNQRNRKVETLKQKSAVNKIVKAYKKSKAFYYSYKIYGVKIADDVKTRMFDQRNEIREARGQNRLSDLHEHNGESYYKLADMGTIILTKRFPMGFHQLEMDNNPVLEFIDYIIPEDIDEFMVILNNLLSAIDGVVLENEIKVNKDQAQVGNLNNEPLMNSNHNVIENKYIVNQLENGEIKSIIQTTDKIACGVDVILSLQESWNKYYANKMTFESVVLQLQQLASMFNLPMTVNEQTVITCNELLGYWFMKYAKLNFKVIDTAGVLLYPINPEHIQGFSEIAKCGINKHLNVRSTVYCLQSNNHLYIIKDKAQSLSESINQNEYSAVAKPSDKFFTLDGLVNRKKEVQTEKVLVLDNLNDIKKIISELEENTKVYYVEPIVDVIQHLINEIKIVPQLNGNILTPTSCFITLKNGEDFNKLTFISLSTTVKSLDDIESTLIDLKAEDMITFNEITDKLNKKLFLNKYTSDYSNDLKDAINQMPTPLMNAFAGMRNAQALCGLDCNKSYGYFLNKIRTFGQFTLFDTYEQYDNHNIESCTIYQCEFVGTDRTDCDKLLSMIKTEVLDTFITFGAVLLELPKIKSYLSDFRIVKFIRPYNVVANPVTDDIQPIFSDKVKLQPNLKKLIPNMLVGRTFKKSNTNKKSYLSTSEKELIYQKQEIKKVNKDAQFTSVKPLSKGLYFMMETNTTQLDNGFCVLGAMVYCFQRLRLIGMYHKLSNKGIRPLGTKTDLVYFDYATLNEQQVQFIESLHTPTEWGKYKIERNKAMPPMVIEKHNGTVELDDIWIEESDDEM